MWYVGLDVHLRTSTCCILDDQGKVVKVHTCRGPWVKMITFLEALRQPLAVCYEASCGYGPIHDRLRRFCRRVVVAHPGRLRLIFRSKRKNDRLDAKKLATLLYLDQVPQVHVPSTDVRAWRQLINFRRRQIARRTAVKSGLRALLRAHGIIVPAEHRRLWSIAGLKWLAALPWPDAASALQATTLLEELHEANQRLQRLTDQLDQLAAAHAGVALLRTIPGVGPRTAEAVVAFLDDPHRFARNRRVGAYAGLVPCQDSSASVNRLGHITKDGPASLRWLLTEATWQVVRCDPGMKAFFQRLAGRHEGHRKIALVATAHKLLRAMHAMLRTGEVWRTTPPPPPPEGAPVPAAA
jgi:transposase